MTKNPLLILALVAALTLSACAGALPGTIEAEMQVGPTTTPTAASTPAAPTLEPTPVPTTGLLPTPTATAGETNRPAEEGLPDATTITLWGDTVDIDGGGAAASGSVVTISAAGTYIVSGLLRDGQLIVDTQDEGDVVLVLDGAEITSSTSAPIYVVSAEKAIITLAAGSVNRVTDGESYVFPEGTDEPDAAIFSHDDLTLTGNGTLIVDANYRNGIAGKDDLKITGGEISVTAVNDALRGRDSVAISDGHLTLSAGADGVQANNDTGPEKGFVVIEGGMLDINAGLDGIQAATSLTVSGGTLNVTAGGGSAATGSAGDASRKGLKAGVALVITGGSLTVDAADDAIHSNGSAMITGGEIVLATGDDGIHADESLRIDDGTLTITRSYEGLESAEITINGGTLDITAGDDGVNVAGGQDGSGFAGGRPGGDQFARMGAYHLTINGGMIIVDADGDGIDANGTIDMSDGTLLIHGPTGNWNGALDYMGAFTMTGGVLVAAGSAGMAQAPSPSSTQYAAMVTFPSMLPGGTPVRIVEESGTTLLTFVPRRAYQSLVVSTPEITHGTTYDVLTGGSVEGTTTGGLLTDGSVTGGTQAASFTVTEIVTGGGMGGRPMPGGPVPIRPGGTRP